MNEETKEYIDQQVQWVRDIKKTENYWLEKYLESEQRAQRQVSEMFQKSMEVWKVGLDEWKDRTERVIGQTVTRREMRTILATAISILISFLGLLVVIFLKK